MGAIEKEDVVYKNFRKGLVVRALNKTGILYIVDEPYLDENLVPCFTSYPICEWLDDGLSYATHMVNYANQNKTCIKKFKTENFEYSFAFYNGRNFLDCREYLKELSEIKKVAFVYTGAALETYPVVKKSLETKETKETNNNNNNNNNNIEEKREEKSMNIGKIFGDFGKVKDKNVALTFDGKVAVKNGDGDFVYYDAKTKSIINQKELVIDTLDYFYVLPVTSVSVGDVLKKGEDFYEVLSSEDNDVLKVISLKTGTIETLVKEKNIFNMNFYYKLTCLLTDGFNNTTTNNINPMMLLMLGDDSKEKDLLPLLLMNTMGKTNVEDSSSNGFNPMMMALLMSNDKKSGDNDLLKIMMLGQMMGGKADGGNAFNPMMMAMLLK